ncbi:hypothetical protein MKJ04_05930 [Pontibacter sp. E15-1]|uniref:hypothetical protein n=1 Tax=Pontibacter sp. E15-1 TaxID=2919918 RepID=UPI001F4FC021|nr:hypothetical protein [Pontibacter sp. E15-1]MCJ8164376.1 hypothetical protein [Pontibacter sp. E15-1]
MPYTTAYESEFYRIEVDLEANILRSAWLRQIDEVEMKFGGRKLYEVLRDTGVERALSCGQSIGVLSAASKDWLATDFYKMLSHTFLKKLARVLPTTVFHRIALESVVTRAEALGLTNFMVKNFTNYEEALAWLRA